MNSADWIWPAVTLSTDARVSPVLVIMAEMVFKQALLYQSFFITSTKQTRCPAMWLDCWQPGMWLAYFCTKKITKIFNHGKVFKKSRRESRKSNARKKIGYTPQRPGRKKSDEQKTGHRYRPFGSEESGSKGSKKESSQEDRHKKIDRKKPRKKIDWRYWIKALVDLWKNKCENTVNKCWLCLWGIFSKLTFQQRGYQSVDCGISSPKK